MEQALLRRVADLLDKHQNQQEEINKLRGLLERQKKEIDDLLDQQVSLNAVSQLVEEQQAQLLLLHQEVQQLRAGAPENLWQEVITLEGPTGKGAGRRNPYGRDRALG